MLFFKLALNVLQVCKFAMLPIYGNFRIHTPWFVVAGIFTFKLRPKLTDLNSNAINLRKSPKNR